MIPDINTLKNTDLSYPQSWDKPSTLRSSHNTFSCWRQKSFPSTNRANRPPIPIKCNNREAFPSGRVSRFSGEVMKCLLLYRLKQVRWSEKMSWLKTEVKPEKNARVETLARQISKCREYFKVERSWEVKRQRRRACLFKKRMRTWQFPEMSSFTPDSCEQFVNCSEVWRSQPLGLSHVAWVLASVRLKTQEDTSASRTSWSCHCGPQ